MLAHKDSRQKRHIFMQFCISRRGCIQPPLDPPQEWWLLMVVYPSTFYSAGPCQANLMISANAKNIMGQTALHNAVTVGYRDVVSLLIKHGADVNLSAGPESHHGGKDTVESPDNLGASTSSPLEIACHQGDLEMLKLLLSHGAEDIDHKCLNSAILADNAEVIMILLQRGNVSYHRT